MELFAKPVTFDYSEQYEAIPFGQIMQFAAQDRARKDKIFDDVSTKFDSILQFSSPFEQEAAAVRAMLPEEAVQAYTERAIADPEFVRSVEGHRALRNLTGNIDYQLLDRAIRNKQNYDSVVKSVPQDWAASGFDVNQAVREYDLNDDPNKGSFNLALPAYKTFEEIATPYFNTLPDTLIREGVGFADMYDEYGVTEDRIEGIAKVAAAQTMDNPAIRQHLDLLERRGEFQGTPEEIAQQKQDYVTYRYMATAKDMVHNKLELNHAKAQASRPSGGRNSGGKLDPTHATYTTSADIGITEARYENTRKNKATDVLFSKMGNYTKQQVAPKLNAYYNDIETATAEYLTAAYNGDYESAQAASRRVSQLESKKNEMMTPYLKALQKQDPATYSKYIDAMYEDRISRNTTPMPAEANIAYLTLDKSAAKTDLSIKLKDSGEVIKGFAFDGPTGNAYAVQSDFKRKAVYMSDDNLRVTGSSAFDDMKGSTRHEDLLDFIVNRPANVKVASDKVLKLGIAEGSNPTGEHVVIGQTLIPADNMDTYIKEYMQTNNIEGKASSFRKELLKVRDDKGQPMFKKVVFKPTVTAKDPDSGAAKPTKFDTWYRAIGDEEIEGYSINTLYRSANPVAGNITATSKLYGTANTVNTASEIE